MSASNAPVRAPPGRRGRLLAVAPVAALLAGTALAIPAQAGTAHPQTSAGPAGGAGYRGLVPGNLLVSGSTYRTAPGIVAGKTVLPPGCTSGCVTATANGTYPQVFNNALVDGSFGITSPIFLDQLTPSGRRSARCRCRTARPGSRGPAW